MASFKCKEHGDACMSPMMCEMAEQNPEMFEQGPVDPVNPGEQAAQQMAFIYRSYRSAGFDARQSLYLAVAVATGNPGIAPLGTDVD